MIVQKKKTDDEYINQIPEKTNNVNTKLTSDLLEFEKDIQNNLSSRIT